MRSLNGKTPAESGVFPLFVIRFPIPTCAHLETITKITILHVENTAPKAEHNDQLEKERS